MEIRNQQDRTSAIWRFVAYTTPVALLLFLGGLLMGNTFKLHSEGCEDSLREAAERTALFEGKLNRQGFFFQKTDSLLTMYVEKFDGVDEKLKSVESTDIQAFNQLEFDLIDVAGDLKKGFKVLENEFSEADSLDTAMRSGLEYARKYANIYEFRLANKIGDMKKLALAGATDELKQLQAQIDEQKKDLEKTTGEKAAEAQTDDLKRKLEMCESDLRRLQTPATSGGGGAKPIDNSGLVTAIIAQTEAIRLEIIKEMPDGLMGKRKKLKEELRGRLDIIDSKVKSIK